MFIMLQFIYDQKVTAKLLEQQAVIFFSGILTTHLFREFIKKSNWLMLPVEKALPKFFVGVIIACLIASLLRIGIINAFDLSSSKKKFDFLSRLLFATLENSFFIVPWTLIYYFYHYIEKSRKHQFDTLKLESLVKELELTTIKSHI